MFNDGDGHLLLLQVKESERSALEPFLARSAYANQGERVARGQRGMQYASDIFLGWSSCGGRDYYVRQFRDMKTGVDLAGLAEQPFLAYVEYCARALAMGHARSGYPAEIAGYLGKKNVFDQAAVAFADRYADLTEADHALFTTREKSKSTAAPEPPLPTAH